MPAVFPEILSEELFYSAVPRFQSRMRYATERAVLEDLFGTSNATALVELPT